MKLGDIFLVFRKWKAPLVLPQPSLLPFLNLSFSPSSFSSLSIFNTSRHSFSFSLHSFPNNCIYCIQPRLSHVGTRSILRVHCPWIKETSKTRRNNLYLRNSWISNKVRASSWRFTNIRAHVLDSVLYRTGLLAALRSKAKGSQVIGVMITASHNPAEVAPSRDIILISG